MMLNILQLIKQGGNPQQIVLSMLESQTQGNPVLENLVELAKNGRGADIEKIARNMMAERGLDYDKEFNAFKQRLGFK